MVAERVRSYLRSFDQRSAKNPPARPATALIRNTFAFEADQWIAVPGTPSAKGKIATIAALLDNIIEQTSKSNLPPDQQILTEIERQQLIAILQTALSVRLETSGVGRVT
jgi:hypothetical protein